MTRVEAPSRLHFGLLNVPCADQERWPGLDGSPGLPVRHFGGVGLMVDRPGLAVRVERANEWSASGPLAERALAFASRFVAGLPTDHQSPFQVAVEQCPEEHVGLGVGTQLGLAVAKALAIEAGHGDWSATELSLRVGRGERSAIGVHGFERGGLIVEGGKRAVAELSPLIAHHQLPEAWSVLLFCPEPVGSWHGVREREAFARLSLMGPVLAEMETLYRVVLTGILPGIAAKDLDLFGEAVYEFNARVGDAFALEQGGRYAAPAVADCVKRLRTIGVKGVGQSSWGPTVFALVPRTEIDRVVAKMKDAPVVAGASSGCKVEAA